MENRADFFLSLVLTRDQVLAEVIQTFRPHSIECHLVGSTARGDHDPYSDLDIWFTVSDTNWKQFINNRIDHFRKLGNIIHICEPPQNAPYKGLFSSVFIKVGENIIVIDLYFCPESHTFITKESKSIFGSIDIPIGVLSLNSGQVSVPEAYRIDFLICFIFGSVKKLARKVKNPLEDVFHQYEHLRIKYGIPVKDLENRTQTFKALKEIIANLKEFTTLKQEESMSQIEIFIDKVSYIENI